MVSETVTRRAFVTGGVGVLALSAGCAALPGSRSASELGPITVENSDGIDHRVHVAVERDTDLVYGTSVTLDAASPGDDADYGSVDSVVLDSDAWTGATAEWTVHARVDGDADWTHHPVPGEVPCHAVRLVVERDASVTGFTPDCSDWPPNGG
jgi:hypothetical protein